MRKVKISRVIILIAGFAIIAGLIVLLTIWVLNMFNGEEPVNTPDPIISEPTEVYDEFTIELEDYEVFKIDEVDFNFVLADIKVGDSEAIDYSLGSLYTDEKTVDITDYQKYIDALDGAGYYVGAKGVDYVLKSDKTTDTFTVFIPVEDKQKESLTIYDAVSKSQLSIDLTKNIGDLNELKYSTGDDSAISTDDYVISVSNAYIETSLVENGDTYTYPSTVQIYAFVLDVIELNDKSLTLEDAVFVPSGSDEEIHALDASIMSMKINNFMSRTVSEGDHGALFFEMYSPHDSGISYSGTLRLKFSNSDNWLSIETEMN